MTGRPGPSRRCGGARGRAARRPDPRTRRGQPRVSWSADGAPRGARDGQQSAVGHDRGGTRVKQLGRHPARRRPRHRGAACCGARRARGAGRSLGRVAGRARCADRVAAGQGARAARSGCRSSTSTSTPSTALPSRPCRGALCRRYTVLPVAFEERLARARDGRPGQRVRARRRAARDRHGRVAGRRHARRPARARSTGSAAPTTRWTTSSQVFEEDETRDRPRPRSREVVEETPRSSRS